MIHEKSGFLIKIFLRYQFCHYLCISKTDKNVTSSEVLLRSLNEIKKKLKISCECENKKRHLHSLSKLDNCS